MNYHHQQQPQLQQQQQHLLNHHPNHSQHQHHHHKQQQQHHYQQQQQQQQQHSSTSVTSATGSSKTTTTISAAAAAAASAAVTTVRKKVNNNNNNNKSEEDESQSEAATSCTPAAEPASTTTTTTPANMNTTTAGSSAINNGSTALTQNNNNNNNNNNNTRSGLLKLNICPATGGQIELNVPEKETVAGLKWSLSRKLKISTEKMTLLFKDRPLKEGSLLDNQVTECSRILLLPNMESGMTFHRPDVGVIQALENLSESQVTDFLSGRAPLLLAMKLGDHMMFVQLQLSTSSCNQRSQTKRPQCSADNKEKAAATAGPVLNSAALAELGHNLSQKLRELSKLSTHQKVPVEHCAATTAVSSTSFPVTEKCQNISSVASTVKPTNTNKNTTITTTTNPPPTPNPIITKPTVVAPATTAVNLVTNGNNPKSCSSSTEPISGAIIESMHHIGQGVYSGTFSGTLDPSLQDLDGKPKRNISTIIHILNDLLGATPQYRTQALPHRTDKTLSEHSFENKGEAMQLSGNHSEEDNALRGKVKDLQMKIEQKRLRRRARREVPYHCVGSKHCASFSDNKNSTTLTYQQHSSLNDGPADSQKMDVDDSGRGDNNINNNNNNKETEMEMTSVPPTTAPAATATATATAAAAPATTSTTPSSSASTQATETSSSGYASSSLEQESVLV